MTMFEMALNARLPLIRVETDDVLNVGAVLAEIAGEKPTALLEGFGQVVEGSLNYIVEPADVPAVKWYKLFSEAQGTLIVINPLSDSNLMFDGGVLATPRPMIESFVERYYGGDNPDVLVSTLGGMSYKDIIEIAKLAMADSGELTVESVQNIRRLYFGSVRGLDQLKIEDEFYFPNGKLKNWIQTDGVILSSPNAPDELRPKGLLFTGQPGTGKTMGAKFIARKLGLPIYLLNIGSLASKYYSESEKNLMRCLSQAENSEPCVLLIDEVEKLFAHTEDSGTTARLLSHLLWWLQEHRARVFTIMTTNDSTAIPPELYREGRIDASIEFLPLRVSAGRDFIRQLLIRKSHLHDWEVHNKTAELLIGLYKEKTDRYSHAFLASVVMDAIKIHYVEKTKLKEI